MVEDPLIEEHLERIGTRLRLHGAYRERVMAELRAHLEDAVDAGVAEGRTRAEATEAAIKELGDPTKLAGGFAPQEASRDRAGLGLLIAGAGLGICAVRFLGEPGLIGGFALGQASMPLLLLAALAVVGVVIARFREQLGVPGTFGAAALATAAAAMLFGGGSYGSLDAYAGFSLLPGMWRLAVVALATTGIALLAWTAWARGLIAAGPLILGGTGLGFVLGSGLATTRELGTFGLLLLAGAAVGAGLTLRRDPPLA